MKTNNLFSLIFIIVPFLSGIQNIHAQNSYDQVLSAIATGNKTLKSKSAFTDASKAENMTGLTLPDPEIEFAYQWGYPVDVFDKKVLDISQSFDFATISGAKKNLAQRMNDAVNSRFSANRLEVIKEADGLMARAVYINRLGILYRNIELHYTEMLNKAESAVAQGAMTTVDANLIKMSLANIKTEIKLNSIEFQNILAILSAMSGGIDINWTPDEYKSYILPEDFEKWSAKALEMNPEIMIAKDNREIADATIKLRKREGLPEFSVGYSSEMVKHDDHYGVSFGMSIPLWGNKGRVKAAKAARAAAENELEDERFRLLAELKMRYDKAKALYASVNEMRQLFSQCDNRTQLKKLYDAGRLSVLEYLTQLTPQFDMAKQILSCELTYQEALVSLRGIANDY